MVNKYGARRTFSKLCQRWFDSKAECRRGGDLHLLQLGAQISDLEYQPAYVLSRDPKVGYRADFRYRDEYGNLIVEDVKGVMTKECRVKLAWVKQKYLIEVVIIK